MAGEHGGHERGDERRRPAAPDRRCANSAAAPIAREPDEAHRQRVAHLLGRRAAAEQVQQHRRAVGRRRGRQRARREPGRPGGHVRARAPAAPRASPTTPSVTATCSASARQRAQHGHAGQRARRPPTRASITVERRSGRGRRRSVPSVSTLTSSPSTSSSTTAGSGSIAANSSGAATQREAEPGRGLQHRAGDDPDAGGGDEHRRGRLAAASRGRTARRGAARSRCAIAGVAAGRARLAKRRARVGLAA